MKLATLKSNHRDGELILVNSDLSRYVSAKEIAPNLQTALDNWKTLQPDLLKLNEALNNQRVSLLPLNMRDLAAPLPRAYQWADGSAYVNHVELVRKARGAEMPESFWNDPLMYQGGSDCLLGCRDPIIASDPEWGIDFEAEVAVITDDVSMGTTPEEAASHILLVMLVNDVSHRNLIPNELAKGFGFFQSKPASAFSPVALTLDELGSHWQNGKLHLPMISTLNGQLFGQPNAGVDMTFNFHQLIAHAAKSRDLAAGTIIGSGTISNLDRSKGSSCIAEKRMLEIIENGSASTPFLQEGDRIQIAMTLPNGERLFGSIDQRVHIQQK